MPHSGGAEPTRLVVVLFDGFGPEEYRRLAFMRRFEKEHSVFAESGHNRRPRPAGR